MREALLVSVSQESAPEAAENDDTNSGTGEDSPRSKINDLSVALREIDKLRDESASRRVSERQLKEDAEKWRKHLDSQKSEMERLSEANASLQQRLEKKEREDLARNIAKDVGLDLDLAEFITGADEHEMRAKAEKLAAKAKSASSLPDLHAGQRGNPVTPKKSSGGSFLEEMARNL